MKGGTVIKKHSIHPVWPHYLNNPKLTYAPAVRVGNFLFVSGLTGVDPSTGNIVGVNDLAAQTRQIFRNLGDILESAGATFDHVVQTTDYITTMENYKNTAEIRREFFGNSLPASVGVVVKDLLRPNALIEISAIAVLED